MAYLIQRNTIKTRKTLLEPPIDLFGDTADELKAELNGKVKKAN